ncbi:hypothetical protein CC86DRAFT_316926 [Ophiobolus disseminans]|uniref:Uncharacterized protein n=1 Tax=Ophiobolus disseminans TaxID=1469910 RepID=A0A6A7AAP1_9PLEO|nr:hypothetical protein CC86DRAFT_316926 [Ophiobolus disseminans]
MLRRLHKQAVEVSEEKLQKKKSKRQRIVQFFRSRKQKPQGHDDVPIRIPVSSEVETPKSPPEETQVTRVTTPKQTPSVAPEKAPSVAAEEHTLRPTPPPAPEAKEAEAVETVETLSEGQIRALFAGAPHFGVSHEHGRPTPSAAYPWDGAEPARAVSDSKRLDQPAFSAATLHILHAGSRPSSREHRQYHGYDIDVVEVPNMLSAQGVEPGSIGFSHFLELPKSDGLITHLDDSQSSKDFLQAQKNKEHMHASPERIGIRAVDMNLVHDRLVELQDLYEAFQDSPSPMSILNHQSPGDLYANLFSKFLTPPGYDGAGDDPTGLRIQILTLMRILKLKGVWYDFSLVEWRIRLGQIMWSDPEPTPEYESHPLWTEREVLLLQITLACELLLRLDAVTTIEASHVDEKTTISQDKLRSFFGSKTRKLDWDLVLARTFLHNVLVVKNAEPGLRDSQDSKSRGFLAMLGVGEQAEKLAAHKPDIVLLPQHQARQLSGLIKFASTIQWPGTETLMQEMARNLGARDVAQHVEQLPSPDGLFLDPVTPASISVYGTPLQTPYSTTQMPDGYFGHVKKHVLTRDHSHSLRIPLSPTLSPLADRSSSAVASVGGWLSRSYLTGLVLPGEAISHFLISTLLENDKTAIESLGDYANLYGGFTYAGRTWWSKHSIVGRVFACLDGAVECMGWISFPKPPEGLQDRWHSIHSEQLPPSDRLSDDAYAGAIMNDSAIISSGSSEPLRAEDLVLPRDAEKPTSPLTFAHWELTELNPDLLDHDALSGPPTENDIHVPSITFSSQEKASSHTLTLGFDIQFITSWPCKPPASTPAPSLPHILKRSLTGTISRTSSKHSGRVNLSRRNSHGFEPLLSHPPDSTDIAPKPLYSVDGEHASDTTITKRHPVDVHPLYVSYKYKVVPATEVLDPDFQPPFDMHAHLPTTRSPTPTGSVLQRLDEVVSDRMAILVLDARGTTDLQLFARAWCAEKGYHAIIARVSSTCLACSIREARGLGVNVVIRV